MNIWKPVPNSDDTTTEYMVTPIDYSADNAFEVRKVTSDNSGTAVDLTLTYPGTVKLSWDDPKDSTINDYQYRQSTDGGTNYGEWLDIESSDASTVTYTVGELVALEIAAHGGESDPAYTFQIRARNSVGNAESDSATADAIANATANPGVPLAAPTGAEVSYDPAMTTFTITWDAHATTNADFEVRGTGPRDAVLLGTAELDTTTNPDTPATSVSIQSDLFGEFTFKVRARNNFGPWSDPVTVIGIASPFTVEGLTREVDEDALAGSNVGKPVVIDASVTGFDVRYSLSGGNGKFAIDSATGQITLAGSSPDPGAYLVTVIAGMSKGGVSSQPSIDVTITVTTNGPWVQLSKLTPIGLGEDKAGNAVAVDGGTGVIVVGAKGAGRVYVYEDVHDFTPAILEPGDTPTEFGVTVAVDGDSVVVGSKSSKVYVFTKPQSGWPDDSMAINETAVLTASDTTAPDGFGEAVAISGDTIVVGAASRDETSGGDTLSDIGGAYIFVKPETTGWSTATSQTATLQGPTTGDQPSNRAAGDFFGRSVAIDGDNVVVGAPAKKTAYLFVKPAGGWTETLEPTAPLNGEGTGFGWSVDIDDDTIVVGEHQNNTGPGAAYVFTGSGGSWSELTKLSGLGADLDDQFGYSVAVSGGYVAVARRNQPDNDEIGSVQVFQKTANPDIPYVLLAPDGEANDRYGLALSNVHGILDGRPVAMDGDLLVIGATGDDERGSNVGAAYVFGRFTPPSVSGGVLKAVDPHSDITVTEPNGITQVTVPGGAVPTDTRAYQLFVSFSLGGCSGVTGGTVHDCISVQLYDRNGTRISFVQDTQLDGEAEVRLSTPSRPFTVRKRSSSSSSWKNIKPCKDDGNDGECFRVVDGSIMIEGITTFSQFASVRTATRPSAPTDLQAVSGNRRVTLSWTAPSNQSTSSILRYQYSQDGGAWNDVPGSDADTTGYVVGRLRNGTLYSFAVRAVNSAGPGLASNIVNARPRSTSRDSGGRARGGSATSHVPPTFDEGASTTRQVAENSPTGTRIGGPLVARDPLERRVLYTKGGPDADLFDVASQTGQIFVRRGTMLDYESGRRTYLIEVVGNTGVGGPGKIAVTIIVTNVPEPGSVVLSPDTPPEVDAEITAALSDPDGGVNGLSWHWQRSSDGRTWNDIPSATSANYTPTEADRGMMLRASVSYNDAAATGINLVSMATGAVPERTPVLDLPGSVTLSPVGAPEVGTEITATLIDPDGGVTGETWQWQRSADEVTWTAIDGASTASYTPVEADVGMMLRANVSYSDAVAAGVSLVSATTEAVDAMPAPDRPGSVTLSPEGTPEIGKAITATVTDPDGEVTGRYGSGNGPPTA